MTAIRYAVLKFVPDIERDECVNIGVVVTPAHGAPVVMTLGRRDASRLRQFGYDAGTDFLVKVRDDVASWGDRASDLLLIAHAEWGGSIRVSEPRAALSSNASQLCEELYERYVATAAPGARPEASRDRSVARRVARKALKDLLPSEAVRSHVRIPGAVEEHSFDIGIQNGHVFHAVATLSFDIRTTRLLSSEVDALAWAVNDVRVRDPKFPLSVVTIGANQRALLERARNICKATAVEIVPERHVTTWAKNIDARSGDMLRSHYHLSG